MALLAQVQPNECDPKEHFKKKGILTTTTEREFQNALWTRSQTLFLRLFSLDIVSFLAGSCFFLPLTPYSLQSSPPPPDSPTQHLPDIFTKFPFDIDRKENHCTHFLAQCVRGGGSSAIKNMILAREERGQHACIARWFLFIIRLIITYPKERDERIEKRIRPNTLHPPVPPLVSGDTPSLFSLSKMKRDVAANLIRHTCNCFNEPARSYWLCDKVSFNIPKYSMPFSLWAPSARERQTNSTQSRTKRWTTTNQEKMGNVSREIAERNGAERRVFNECAGWLFFSRRSWRAYNFCCSRYVVKT